MASRIEIRVARPPLTEAGIDEALRVFADVDRTCTRFDDASDLMRANAAGEQWAQVDTYCFNAVREAHAAYRRTNGRFDPRVLTDLVRLGYGQSMKHVRPGSAGGSAASEPRTPLPAWSPDFRPLTRELRVGPHPVDLGGIGKGLAVRWAAAKLRAHGMNDHLVEAGGDCYCAGTPSDADAWHVAVEHPTSDQPAAVLAVRDQAVSTSSVRVLHWKVGEAEVHHLIDPATGEPGGGGLQSVTVVGDDPADAEVWTKVLFLTGRRGVATTAELFGLAALWVDTDGVAAWSSPMRRWLVWSAS
jgi:thiamine biosynthesis lipoprotein